MYETSVKDYINYVQDLEKKDPECEEHNAAHCPRIFGWNGSIRHPTCNKLVNPCQSQAVHICSHFGFEETGHRDTPCMAYLLTFTYKMIQFCGQMCHTWSIWGTVGVRGFTSTDGRPSRGCRGFEATFYQMVVRPQQRPCRVALRRGTWAQLC